MTRQDIVPVDIRKNIYEKLHQIKDATGVSIREYVNETLLMRIEKDEFLKKYAPFLEKIGIQENRITIRDNKKDKLTDVYLKDSKLFCTLDESTDCIHIHFALALPELGMLKKN